MGIEIERRFLVKTELWHKNKPEFMSDARCSLISVTQGYLCTDKRTTTRVRLCQERDKEVGYLTVKGPLHQDNIRRTEFEYEIPVNDARDMLKMSQTPLISKLRYIVPLLGKSPSLKWEVDEFQGDNFGLILAEIELPEPEIGFLQPEWLGAEITHLHEFSNLALAMKPIRKWATDDLETYAANVDHPKI